jgi:hypothetical protein
LNQPWPNQSIGADEKMDRLDPVLFPSGTASTFTVMDKASPRGTLPSRSAEKLMYQYHSERLPIT